MKHQKPAVSDPQFRVFRNLARGDTAEAEPEPADRTEPVPRDLNPLWAWLKWYIPLPGANWDQWRPWPQA